MDKTKLSLSVVVTIVFAVTALQIAGPYLYGFANWCNVIQYVSGYEDIGLAYLVTHMAIDYYTSHKRKLIEIEQHLLHLRKEKEHAEWGAWH